MDLGCFSTSLYVLVDDRRQEHRSSAARKPDRQALLSESAKRAWTEEGCRWAAGKPQIIEGAIRQLKDLSGSERHRTKTLGGLLSRLVTKRSTPVSSRSPIDSVACCAM